MRASREYDYILVGQGIAGTVLGTLLQDAGRRVLFVDQGHRRAASNVAAGIINPLTGRKFVKSWMIDELIAAAIPFYRNAEKRYQCALLYDRPLVRALVDLQMENEVTIRSTDPGYQKYILKSDAGGNIEGLSGFGRAVVLQAFQVDFKVYIVAFRNSLLADGALLEEKFDLKKLSITETGITYQNYRARHLVFCEGYLASSNPLFPGLPFKLAKGHALLCRIPGLSQKLMYKCGCMLAPWADDMFWIGSDYLWTFEDAEPEASALAVLEEKLSALTKKYEVVDRISAIRPTVRDRRPLLGTHPIHRRVHIFNGLGTKGASLAPFFAQVMYSYLEEGNALPGTVNIARFAGKSVSP